MILAGDVGGTKTLLALFDPSGPLVPRRLARFDSRAFSGLPEIVRQYGRQGFPPVRAACFGVAGPVIAGRCPGPNLPWTVALRPLQRALGLETVALLNDLEATAYGVLVLPEREGETLQVGQADPRANAAVIAAGTGLGEAIVLKTPQGIFPSASEGGHSDFAPQTPLEIELLAHLQDELGHVSWDQVVSGPGLVRIDRFLRERARAEVPPWLERARADGDPAAAIARAALAGTDPLCQQAVEVFVGLYGAEAGNLALKALARGGVYLGGGIAPKLLPRLREGPFLERFVSKGPMRPLLEAMPVKVLLNPQAALWGAAHYARTRLLAA